jgi:tRNA pseudouridine32 synthase/23S rRNA pseudouridine746 synthase
MLPVRNGVGPSSVGLTPGPWPRVVDFLCARFPAVEPAEWARRLAAGDVVDDAGRTVRADQPYAPHGKLHYYRTLPPEPRVADDEQVLFEDDWLVVADKPHFLPVTPGGRYLQETLLVRLRRRLGLDALAPLHRIDREAAGLVLFAKQPATRALYEALFAQRLVHKVYEAIAPWRPDLAFPLTRANRIGAAAHFMQMRELPDGADPTADPTADPAVDPAANPAAPADCPNAITHLDCLEVRGAWARYRLQPVTGQRHQLRVHMAALGLPLCGDRIYPALAPQGSDLPGDPLRLLARQIGFSDPVSGQQRLFQSRRALAFPSSTG